MIAEHSLTISQVAKAAEVNVETVKYYEKRDLLTKPERTEAGYRMFTKASIDEIRFIKKAQQLGFTLNEIKQLLALTKHDSFDSSKHMYELAARKIEEVDHKIKQLMNLKSLLEQATEWQAHAEPICKQDCPVLNKIMEE